MIKITHALHIEAKRREWLIYSLKRAQKVIINNITFGVCLEGEMFQWSRTYSDRDSNVSKAHGQETTWNVSAEGHEYSTGLKGCKARNLVRGVP